jgi:hypothetical protein
MTQKINNNKNKYKIVLYKIYKNKIINHNKHKIYKKII